MLPLLALSGANTAMSTISGGVSWLKKQIGASQNSTSSVAGKASAGASDFLQQLTAHTAGQNQPAGIFSLAQNELAGAPTSGSAATNLIASSQTSTTDMLARVQAGIAAYGRVKSHGS